MLFLANVMEEFEDMNVRVLSFVMYGHDASCHGNKCGCHSAGVCCIFLTPLCFVKL